MMPWQKNTLMLRNNKNLTWSNNSAWISKRMVDERGGGCSNQSKIFREINASKLQGQHAALSNLIYVDVKVMGSHPEVFLEKGVLIICSKFTGEHPWQSVISIKLLRIFHDTVCIKRYFSFSKAFHQSKLTLINKV